ncbi:uncharacterized protein LOC105218881 isoform X2 [Zeugodacus cucurbitae]|uniref:uncharacterized protein LOC105218881 isoform X2 n=1 Tax=Zeugodacus cucurbitae TaxID=28588 RepID=UPI0023D92677|nr:uncharacterized protein LOC105218881 isoform X2 [Zeugodacus cucurbitae]
MSHNIRMLLAIIASIVTICSSLPDYHKQMSPTQLQSVFHVDDVNAVPHYEVVQLLHNSFDDGLASLPEHYRRRRRRSINSVDGDRPTIKEPHHVKKDLSKNPYYSELKAAANTPGAGGVNSLQQAANGKYAGDLRDLKEHKVSFNAFGENLNLTLKRTDSLFKGGSPHTLRMWNVRDEANATHGLDLQEVFDEDTQSSEQIGEVYQDEANMAAILMRRHLETGDLIMEGSIGHEMVIKPLPHELSPNPDAAHHVVYKREAQPLEHLSDFAFMEPDDLATSEKLERLQQHRQRRAAPADDDDEAALEEVDGELDSAEARFSRNRRQLPYIIYPEVLVIIDYDGYRLHGGDNAQVKRYFVSFWNGVDLRYRLLKGPRIRISIAGIIISRGRDATPYLERNRVGRDAIDSAAALTDMGKYLFRERRLPVYDIAVAITKYDMCRRRKGGRCTKGTAGFAYVGGACVVNKRLEKVNSVAIIEDTGGFSGIIVAAHEVGHLLGAVHDGSPPPSYLGGPGAQRCRWEDGYIMSDLRHTERGFRWSPCTIQSFHHFLNGDTATCLHNAPHEDSALGRALPGTLLSLDAQCRRDRGTYACFKDERVCAQLFCFDAQTGYCVAYRPAAEGSTCGSGLTCLDGRCTPLTSNVIPAYRSYNDNNNSAENTSSEEEDDEEEDTGENISSEEEQDALAKNNAVEKTSRVIDDTSDPNRVTTKTITTSNTNTPTETNSRTTITLETHSKHRHNNNNNNINEQQRQVQQGTLEFLARFLAQNPQWQQLLGQAAQVNALSGAATNEADVAAKETPPHIKAEVVDKVASEQTQHAELPPGAVVVQTSVSSSTSSSSGSSLGSSYFRSSSSDSSAEQQERYENNVERVKAEIMHLKTNQKTLENQKIVVEDTATLKIAKNIERNIDNNNESKVRPLANANELLTQSKSQPIIQTQPQHPHTTTILATKLTQIQQRKATTTTTPTSTTAQPNLFQIYTHELRKQLQYYLGFLRAHSGDSVSAGDSSSSNRKRTATVLKHTVTNNTNHSNYSNTLSAAAKLQQQTAFNHNNNNNEDDIEDNEDNLNDSQADVDDDASNEAIDDKQQKRKFNTATTISVNAQQQHTQRAQQASPPSAPTRSSISSSSSNGGGAVINNNNSNNNKALQRPATFIDAYLKKLQALNAPTDTTATLTATTTSTTMSTSSVVGSGGVGKAVRVAVTPENEPVVKRAPAETFGSQFLKRTQNSLNSRGSSSSGVDGSVGNSSDSNNNSNNNNNQNRNHKKLTRISSHNTAVANSRTSYDDDDDAQVVVSDVTTHMATTTQQPAYVTNYLGDNTNNLPRLLEQQQQQEQQSSSTTTTTTSSQQQTTQQKEHKVRTQKLIRRQLLRTQIK